MQKDKKVQTKQEERGKQKGENQEKKEQGPGKLVEDHQK